MRLRKPIVITGGAGFIASHLIRLFIKKNPVSGYQFLKLAAATYADNLENLTEVQGVSNYGCKKVNLLGLRELERICKEHNIDGAILLTAQSHVDRSINFPWDFFYTNVVGADNAVNAGRKYWNELKESVLSYHTSTGEVYIRLRTATLFTGGTSHGFNFLNSTAKGIVAVWRLARSCYIWGISTALQ